MNAEHDIVDHALGKVECGSSFGTEGNTDVRV